jgi:cell division inhibitor SulA/protein ImuA
MREPGAPLRAVTIEQFERLHRDGEWQRGERPTAPSGFAALDASLPGSGWPLGAVCELLSATSAIGELSLMLPALSRLAQAGRYIAWIAPPYLPYAPALAQRGLTLERMLIVQSSGVQESLWAAEQALRCPAFGAVLGWPAGITDRNVRRLQLAAEAGSSLGILYRPIDAAREHSPAALRLRLAPMPDGSGLSVEIHKCRGGRTGVRLQLPLKSLDAALAVHTPAAAGH